MIQWNYKMRVTSLKVLNSTPRGMLSMHRHILPKEIMSVQPFSGTTSRQSIVQLLLNVINLIHKIKQVAKKS
jgi:hypothetical protein